MSDAVTEPSTNAVPLETTKPKTSRVLLNFWLDAALFVTLIFIGWVSVMLQAIFPPPTQAAGWSLWGLTFDEWRNVQFAALCLCALLALEHVVLHWQWVCSVIATKICRVAKRPAEASQAVYGVATFITILVSLFAALLAALFSVARTG